jgi:hypothetical protein
MVCSALHWGGTPACTSKWRVDEHRQRAPAQPGDQFVAVGRGQDLVQGIRAAGLLDPGRHRQQVQVVVAEQGLDPAAAGFRQRLHVPQGRQRFRPAIDQVANKEDARFLHRRRVGGDTFQQQAGFMGAPLQVANHIGFHHVAILMYLADFMQGRHALISKCN